MTLQDARLRGGGLGELARLLGDAMPYPDDVVQCAVRLGIRTGSFRSTGTTDQQWQSLVERADDDPNVSVAQLVQDVLEFLPNGGKRSSIQAWLVRGGHALSRSNAIAECSRLLNELTAFPDPRHAASQVSALSGVVRDIVSLLDTRQTGPAEDTVALSAQQAAGAVRRLEAALQVAEGALARIGASARAEAAFEAEFSIVGQLVDAVTLVEQHVSKMLGAMRGLRPG